MGDENMEVSLGQLCELVQNLNARLVESERAQEARFTRLENGLGPNHTADPGAADPGLSQTNLEPDCQTPGRIRVNWTAFRPEEIARRFETALARRAVSKEEDPNFRSLQATWAHLVHTYNVPDFLLKEYMGAGFIGRAHDVLVELYNTLPTVSSADVWGAVERRLFNGDHLEILRRQYDEMTQKREESVGVYV